MSRMSRTAVILAVLLTSYQGIAAQTIRPVRVDRSVQGRVIGSSPPIVGLLATTFADPVHGFLATQNGTCPGVHCTSSLLATANGGQTWRTVKAGVSFRDLSFISPRHGFGVDDMGKVRATHDAGRRWSGIPALGGKAARIDFVDAQHGWLLAGPLAGDLYRTVDGGSHWTHLPFRCGRMQTVSRLSFVDRSTGFLLCQVENGPFAVVLYRSDDGGTSWRKVSTVDSMAHVLGAFDFISSQIGLVGAGFGNLLRTTDGGHTFRPVPGTPFEGVQHASWFGTQVGYVSTNTVLMRTGNAGGTWQQIYPAPKPQGPISLTTSGAGVGAATAWSPTAILHTAHGIDWQQVAQLPATSIDRLVRSSAGAVWAVASSVNGSRYQVRLFRSTDGGLNWQHMLHVPGGSAFLSFIGARLGFLATTTPFQLYMTRDGGTTWSRRTESVRTWHDQFVSATAGWALGAGANLLHTDDGGIHWRIVPIQLSGLHPADLYFLNPSDGWITGTRCDTTVHCVPIMLRTRDGGDHWIIIRFRRPAGFDGFDWVTPQLGYLLGESTLYRTQDGGVNWRMIRG